LLDGLIELTSQGGDIAFPNFAHYSVVSSFLKDVTTLAAAGELTEILTSVKELNRHLSLTDKDNVNVITANLKNGKSAARGTN
jgi:hypothetical protein